MKQVVSTLSCPSNPGGNLNQPLDPTEAGKYFRTHYYGSAGTRSYPKFHVARSSLFNPFNPATPNPASPPALSDGLFTRCRNFGIQDAIDGTTNTILLGERQFYDPVFDSNPEVDDQILDQGWVWFGGEGDVMLSTSVPINLRLPINFNSLSDGAKQLLYDDRINAYGSMHSGGANFSFADGSVTFISQNISYTVFRAIGTRAGSEPINDYQ